MNIAVDTDELERAEFIERHGVAIEVFEEPQSARRLATVRTVNVLEPIEGADRIELAHIDGWKVIVQKGLYAEGDMCVYFEIDSFIPNAIAPFLTKEGKEPRTYKDVPGERLKTMKMRGVVSQGLLMPIPTILALPDCGLCDFTVDDDLTELLGIIKWEKDIPQQLRGKAAGYFPSELRKTDQERVQNARKIICVEDEWEVTLKLDGSSMTAYIDADDVFWVCSRNLRLIETPENAFWNAARKFDMETKLRALNAENLGRFALQGEIMGPGIQGNKEGFTDIEFFLFDIFSITAGEYVLPSFRTAANVKMGLRHAPFLGLVTTPRSVDQFLEDAEGPSINAKVREGIVMKSLTRPGYSFKAISNTFLLKHPD